MNKNLLLAYLSLTFITVCSFNIKAQSAEKIASESNVDPKATLLTIDKDPVTVAEFENIYKKNSTVNVEGAEKKDIEEYLQLFINYKLKVREAERLGLDTVKSFIKEFSNYRRQLAKPYLSDNDVTDGLIKEAYDRMNQEVRASHILIKVGMDASPEDTLKAYRKVLSIRKRLLRGEKFERVAVETSEDPSAKSNKGDLGYFTVFRMVYAFETAAYNTEVGKVSKPARTRFGYHLVKVIDKREAKGQIHVAHIMKKASVKMSPEERALAHKQIEDIYAKLLENGEFGKLASEQSDDKTSARKGGELPKFGTGRMVQEFEDAAFALKEDGDISKPVKTEYGWHIIKRISKKEIGTFDELKDGIKKRIAKDTRAMRSKDLFIDKIKKENNFKEHTSSKRELYRKIDDSALKGKWDVTVTDGMDKPIFEIGDVSYTQHDFAQYVNKNQVKRLAKSVDVLLKILYKRYVDKKCMEYEESQLEDKYPDFKTLMKEYWDGILLFELTDQKVWTMAVKDTTGLRSFYKEKKGNYMWPHRVDAMIITCKNEEVAKKTRKLAKKSKNSRKIILEKINTDEDNNLNIQQGKFVKGDNANVDAVAWEKGLSENVEKNGKIVFVRINAVLEPQVKSLNESRGLVIADYQNYLEEKWIKGLREKYKVEVKKEVFSVLLKESESEQNEKN